jgi:class 3 adenylate cyclase
MNHSVPSSMSKIDAPDAKDVAILFLDLVNCSAFASVLGLKEYADYLHSFHEIALGQCRHYFEHYLEGKYTPGVHYSAQIAGDELLVYMHTDRPQNDVYQLACLAVMIKMAWLGSAVNVERIRIRTPVAEISGGIHFGPLWAVPRQDGYDFCGYGINLAKRIESHSRVGNHYRIFLSDHAYKQIHLRQRHLIFGPRMRFDAKGIFSQVGAYELAHAFLNPQGKPIPRLKPQFAAGLCGILVDTIRQATQDVWMHDLYQVWNEQENGKITLEASELCKLVMRHSPQDPVALFFAAQWYQEQGDLEMAILLMSKFTRAWAEFGDGHFELGKLLLQKRNVEAAQQCFRHALLNGVSQEEIDGCFA